MRSVPLIGFWADLTYQRFRDALAGMAEHPEVLAGTVRLEVLPMPRLHQHADEGFSDMLHRCQGVVAGLGSEAMHVIPLVRAIGRPVVNISRSQPIPELPLVAAHDRLIGRRMVEHLAQHGARSVIATGRHPYWFVEERMIGIAAAAHELELPLRRLHDGDSSLPLRELPLPVGIVSTEAATIAAVMTMISEAGLEVPAEALVIGVEDRFIQLPYANQVSTIDINAVSIGRTAIDLLLRRVAGQQVPMITEIDPGDIVERMSTVRFASDDVEVRDAVHRLRDGVGQDSSISQILRGVGCSRRTLEDRFRRSFGRSPLQVLAQLRIDHACRLLRTTSSSISEIATRSGYGSTRQFNDTFRAMMGITPGAWREQRQPKGNP
jgi:LacI family transcriptional regulator